jgi:hypothetical protein
MISDEIFLAQLEACQIPKEQWTHAAHIRMAWCYLRKFKTWQQALPAVREGIHRLNRAHDNPKGYHESITVAYLRIMDERFKRNHLIDWEAFTAAHPDLLDYGSPVFLIYYHRETIFSPKARQYFMEPDICSLPG